MSVDREFRVRVISTADTAAIKRTKDELKETAEWAKVYSKKEADAAAAAVAGDAKSFASKRQLKDAVKGLSMEFPVLGRLAGLALNPITAAVALTASAFALWTMRMENAVRVLAGVELPDISDDRLKKFERMASSTQALADNLRKVVEQYRSVEAASDRELKGIDKQADAEKKRLENQKKVELARLEMAKGGMAPADYELAKAGIESRYERGVMAIDEQAELRRLGEKARRQANLQIRAERDAREAAGIQVASPEREADMEERHRKLAEAAATDKTERQSRLGRLVDMSDSAWERAKFTPWYYLQYGLTPGADARDIERAGIAKDDEVLARYDQFMGTKAGRASSRKRREDLIRSAGEQAGEAWVIGQELPGETADYHGRQSMNRETAAVDDFSRLAQVSSQAAAEQAQLRERIAKQIESTGSASREMVQALDRQVEINDSLSAAIRRLEGQVANLRNP